MSRHDTAGSPAAGLPAAAAVELAGDPLAVAIVRVGCRGYWLITRSDDPARAAAIREAINCALGVSPAQREAMLAGSMFGFDCPAADPATYTADGRLLPAAGEDNATGCAHEWNQSAAAADEARIAGDYAADRIYCIKCGADGDA